MKKRKVFLKDIIAQSPEKEYGQLYADIMLELSQGTLAPVRSAGTNGKKPALPVAFWEYVKEPDYGDVSEKLDFKLHPLLHTAYYRKHPEQFAQDEDKIMRLSTYLTEHIDLLELPETMNERSFEIFGREKFFQQEGGLQFCSRLGIERGQLNFYDTAEPLSYYSYSKKTPQNILIIENKDTFFDIRRYMNYVDNRILGKMFDTVIYGAGKGIYRTFSDYVQGAEDYFNAENMLYYFGDIDYEGILIYEHLAGMPWENLSGKAVRIDLFVTAYEKMLDKAENTGLENLPDTKEKQNSNIGTLFLSFFKQRYQEQIVQILRAGKYIPQEILNEHDWG